MQAKKKRQLRGESEILHKTEPQNERAKCLCANEDGVDSAWNKFKRDVLEAAEDVCARRKCRKEKRTKWSKGIEMAVTSKEAAYRR